MQFRIDASSPVAPAQQIVLRVLDGMARGVWSAGDRLPSVRSLAAEALINPNTVGKAYRELEHLGAVKGRAGAGVFVTEEGPRRARSLRRGQTLREVERAVAAAMDCGVSEESVRSAVERRLRDASGEAVHPLDPEATCPDLDPRRDSLKPEEV